MRRSAQEIGRCGIRGSRRRFAPSAASVNSRAASASPSPRFPTGIAFPPSACSRSRRQREWRARCCGPIFSTVTLAGASTKSMPLAPRSTRCSSTLLARSPDARVAGAPGRIARRSKPARHGTCGAWRSRCPGRCRARRQGVLRSLHRPRPRRAAALRFLLSDGVPPRAPPGAAARRSQTSGHRADRRAVRARRSRRHPVRDHGRACRGRRSRLRREPTARSSRSTWRHGSGASSAISSAPRRRISMPALARSAGRSWK